MRKPRQLYLQIRINQKKVFRGYKISICSKENGNYKINIDLEKDGV